MRANHALRGAVPFESPSNQNTLVASDVGSPRHLGKALVEGKGTDEENPLVLVSFGMHTHT